MAKLIKIQLPVAVTVETGERLGRDSQFLLAEFLIATRGTGHARFTGVGAVIFLDQTSNLFRHGFIRSYTQKRTRRGRLGVHLLLLASERIADGAQFRGADGFIVVQIELAKCSQRTGQFIGRQFTVIVGIKPRKQGKLGGVISRLPGSAWLLLAAALG